QKAIDFADVSASLSEIAAAMYPDNNVEWKMWAVDGSGFVTDYSPSTSDITFDNWLSYLPGFGKLPLLQAILSEKTTENPPTDNPTTDDPSTDNTPTDDSLTNDTPIYNTLPSNVNPAPIEGEEAPVFTFKSETDEEISGSYLDLLDMLRRAEYDSTVYINTGDFNITFKKALVEVIKEKSLTVIVETSGIEFTIDSDNISSVKVVNIGAIKKTEEYKQLASEKSKINVSYDSKRNAVLS
ncbi:MAG: hypothetical protein IJ305_02800, partial [Oscillospiraceae bacterium]|nr:hypothetical protein [Oscillospiraceae bacterium]